MAAMPPEKGLSLVVATIGRTEELQRLIESLRTQTAGNFEVIIIDQNSDDRLAPIVRHGLNAGLAVRHVAEPNANASRARNTGLNQAAYPIVAFPDDDCWYERDVIETVLAAFEQDHELEGIVGCWVERPARDPNSRRLCWRNMQRFEEPEMSCIQFFFRRDLVRSLGGFDESLGPPRWFGGGEDSDLVMRLVAQGSKVSYVPQVRIHHDLRTFADTPGSIRDRWMGARNRARGMGALCAKHQAPASVLARAFFAPILKCFVPPYRRQRIAAHLATSLGRWEGYSRWRSEQAECDGDRSSAL